MSFLAIGCGILGKGEVMEIVTCYYGSHSRGCWKRLRHLLLYATEQGHSVHLLSHLHQGSRITGIFHHELAISGGLSLPDPKTFVSWGRDVFLQTISKLNNPMFFAFDLHNAYLLNQITEASLGSIFIRSIPKYHAAMNNLPPHEEEFIRYAAGRGFATTRHLIFNSLASAKDFCAIYGRVPYFKVIYNNAPTPTAIPRTGLDPNSNLRIGFIGQFISRKNPLFLVKSLRDILVERNLHLLYKGHGELLHDLQKYVVDNQLQEYVGLEDWGDNVDGFYANIDILIVPSLYDECPNVILEALAHNVVVLGARTGGIPELLHFDERLLFSVDDDGVDLQVKVSAVISSPRDLSCARDMCRSYAEAYDFDWGAKALDAILV